MPVVQHQFCARSAIDLGGSFAVQTTKKHVWRNGASIVALAGALALSGAPAWADGGIGGATGAPNGQAGVDGNLAEATGKDGGDSLVSSDGGIGGGGAVDLTTGNGAPGGARGAGNVTPHPARGQAGTTGAAGLVVTTATDISTAIVGGAGGAGQVTGVNNTAGGGGGGGVGVSTSVDLTITSTGSVRGGAGASGVAAGGSGAGVFSTALVAVAAGGQITGGTSGANNATQAGGGGGMGMVLAAGGGLVNNGKITGGSGSKGGGVLVFGGGGDGGAGVWVTGGGTVVNGVGGSITGGIGGAGRYSSVTGSRGGLGGEGVKGSDITLINAGSISGAMGGASQGVGAPAAVSANAVTFLGGVNTLELQAGSVITGNVVAFSAADTLRLGGDLDEDFDVSKIGTAAQYRNFGIYEKTGSSTWTLLGATSEITPWTLFDGTLSVSSDDNLGAAAGSLTFNGGALRNTAAFSSVRDITLGAPGGMIETLAELTLTGVISGPGTLTKTGASTLTLSGTNSYNGETLIQAGALALAGTGSLSNSSRVVANGTFDISAVTAAGADVQRLAGSGAVNLGDKTLTLTNANDLFSGIISGTGGLTVLGGTETLSGANNYSGTTSVEGGTLRAGAANTFSAASAHNVLVGGTLDLGGLDQTIGALDNAGVVRLGGSVPGTALTVTGNYVGSGGTVHLNTALGGDGSTTDLLVVDGDTFGNSTLSIANVGGAGAQTNDGIKVVSVAGASNGIFSLNGDYLFEGDQAVVGGAYAYRLYQGELGAPADGDWYLRSSYINPDVPDPQPLYAPGVPLYEAYAGVLQRFNELGTLQQRVGNRSWGPVPRRRVQMLPVRARSTEAASGHVSKLPMRNSSLKHQPPAPTTTRLLGDCRPVSTPCFMRMRRAF